MVQVVSQLSFSYVSVFGRAEYNYADRYYADLSLRADASSRFGKDHRWGQFWSVGLMWNAKKELFLKDVKWLHNAQVSFSTGTSGNSEIPNVAGAFVIELQVHVYTVEES